MKRLRLSLLEVMVADKTLKLSTSEDGVFTVMFSSLRKSIPTPPPGIPDLGSCLKTQPGGVKSTTTASSDWVSQVSQMPTTSKLLLPTKSWNSDGLLRRDLALSVQKLVW